MENDRFIDEGIRLPVESVKPGRRIGTFPRKGGLTTGGREEFAIGQPVGVAPGPSLDPIYGINPPQEITGKYPRKRPIGQPQPGERFTQALIPVPGVPGANFSDGSRQNVWYQGKLMPTQEFFALVKGIPQQRQIGGRMPQGGMGQASPAAMALQVLQGNMGGGIGGGMVQNRMMPIIMQALAMLRKQFGGI